MAFERTKQVASSHTAEEVAAEADDKDLKNEADETADETGRSDEQTTDGEEETSTNEGSNAGTSEDEDVIPDGMDPAEYWKGQAQKARENEANYKQGMLSAKAKKRNLEAPAAPATQQVDVNEAVVENVLNKRNENLALQNTINPKHADYIPELVDDLKYSEIIAYLPRSMDKSDYGSIVKSLKLATKLWKEDKGIKDPVKPKGNVPGSKTSQASSAAPIKPQKFERKFLGKSGQSMKDWYN